MQYLAPTAPTPTAVPAVAPAAPPAMERAAVLSSEEWMENIKSDAYWAKVKRKNRGDGEAKAIKAPPMNLGIYGIPADSERWRSDEDWNSSRFGGGSYRTMCVRMCDGYFFPVSFATTPDRFDADEATCQSSCGGSEARLFVYPNPGAEVEDMRDLDGRAYRRLKTAFLFRTTFDASCKCKAHPWEQEARDRHRAYAQNGAKPPVPRKRADRRTRPTIQTAALTPLSTASLRPVITTLNDFGSGRLSPEQSRTVRAFSGSRMSLVVLNGPVPKPGASANRAQTPPLPKRRGSEETYIRRVGAGVPSSARSN